MLIIFHEIYRPKCHIFVKFRFSCSNFNGHFKGQNFKTHFSRCVCIERRVILKLSESLDPKEPDIKKI